MLFFTAPLLYAGANDLVFATSSPFVHTRTCTIRKDTRQIFFLLPLFRSHSSPTSAWSFLMLARSGIFQVFYRASGCIHAHRSHFKTSFHHIKKQPIYLLSNTHTYTLSGPFCLVCCIFFYLINFINHFILSYMLFCNIRYIIFIIFFCKTPFCIYNLMK